MSVPAQGEAVQQLREALKILAERVLILEHMIGIHGKSTVRRYSMTKRVMLRQNLKKSIFG